MTRQAVKKPRSGGRGSVTKARRLRPAIGKDGKCNAAKRGGGKCTKTAGWGTDHVGYGPCKLHGGSMPNVVKHAQDEMAADAVATYGLPRRTNPHQALLEELDRTAGHVAWLGQVVAALDKDTELVGPVGEEGEDSKTGTMHHPSVEPSVWVKMYQAERKHLTDVAATCLKVGIEERRVRVAEAQAQLFAQALTGILADLGVTINKRVGEVVRKHMTAIDAAARELEPAGG